jgi:hypothetical protein
VLLQLWSNCCCSNSPSSPAAPSPSDILLPATCTSQAAPCSSVLAVQFKPMCWALQLSRPCCCSLYHAQAPPAPAAAKAAASKDVCNVAVLGASGYTGAEVMRLSALHPNIRITALTGDRQAGKVGYTCQFSRSSSPNLHT